MSDFSLTEINDKIARSSRFVDDLKNEMIQAIQGQDELVDKLIIAMLANGHILLEGVPGLAKTLMVNTLAKLIKTNFQRLQFTPDMLPADLLGTLIYNQKTSEFDIRKGPIFSNIILADEINRSPASGRKYQVSSRLMVSGQSVHDSPGSIVSAVRRFGTSPTGWVPARYATSSPHAPAALTTMGADIVPTDVSIAHAPARRTRVRTSAPVSKIPPASRNPLRYPIKKAFESMS